MIIKVLVENTSIDKNFENEHGLSLYIELPQEKILFDMGQGNLFIDNANKMDVSISKVDIAFISHGHYDHGGGLSHFLAINKNANIYAHPNIFKNFYAKREAGEFEYIGLDKKYKSNSRFIFSKDYHRINNHLEVFSNVEGNKYNPYYNKTLYTENKNIKVRDDFIHEQNLIITQEDVSVLIAGCAHKGIINIMEKYYTMKGCYPDYVIGGFHLYNHGSGASEDAQRVREIATELNKVESKYYTGHCTGKEAYLVMKQVLGDKLHQIKTGITIQI